MDGGKTGTWVGVPRSDAICQFSLAEMPHDPCCPKCLKDLVRDMLTNMSWRARGGGGTVLPFRFHFRGGFFGGGGSSYGPPRCGKTDGEPTVSLPGTPIQRAAGAYHSVALDADGVAWVWGVVLRLHAPDRP